MRRFYIFNIIAAALFVYYRFEACPTYYFWDSAELTAAALGGGVPHPPGFPSLLLLSKLWNSIIPGYDPHVLNLFSAFFASLGLAAWFLVIFDILRIFFPERKRLQLEIISILAISVLGVSYTFTIQAVRFEVYSMNFACFAFLMLIMFRILKTNSGHLKYYIAAAAVVAVSLGGHHLTAALAIPGVLILLYTENKLNYKLILIAIGVVLVITIPLYYSISYFARGNSSINWGNPSDWARFRDYFFLKEFSLSSSSFHPAHILTNLIFAVKMISAQVGVPGIIAALWGLYKIAKVKTGLAVSFALIIIANILSILYFEDYFYENNDIHGYLMISTAMTALMACTGIVILFQYLEKGLLSGKAGDTKRIKYLTVAVLAILLVAPGIFGGVGSSDLGNVMTPEKFSSEFLDGAPEGSIVITSYYNTYFCLLAYETINPSANGYFITNVYNWDHKWGRDQTAESLGEKDMGASDRSGFYRDLLNAFKGSRSIYVEYDKASAPITKFLKPSGLGYIFSVGDTSLPGMDSQKSEISRILEIAVESNDIESIRTWLWWFQNRGEFYIKRGNEDSANLYFSAVDSLASVVDLE